MSVTLHPNATLVFAVLLTIGLAVFFCLPLPAGPDRAAMGFACFFLQTPRWICMALVLGLCVAKGAFAWPESRWAQFVVVFVVHTALGFGAICAGLSGLGVTSGVPYWLSRVLALSTILVPSLQIAFAAWFLNPGLHKKLDATAMRNETNLILAVFGAVVGVFALAGAAAWVLTNANSWAKQPAKPT